LVYFRTRRGQKICYLHFVSLLRSIGDDHSDIPEDDKGQLDEIQEHIKVHGNGVKDVAFVVDDAEAVYNAASSKGANSVEVSTRGKNSFPSDRALVDNGSLIRGLAPLGTQKQFLYQS